MADDPEDRRVHKSRALSTSLRFKTASDAKLAGLFLENDFPIVLFKKVFDVIFDPDFKVDDVTFIDIWDMFEYISARRRKDATKRVQTVLPPHGDDTVSQQVSTTRGTNTPPLVLDLVVDRLIEDQLPLGVAAMEPRWETSYNK